MSGSARKVRDILSDLFPSWTRGAEPTWPPDAFAIVASVLRDSGGYTEIVHQWPPDSSSLETWRARIAEIARGWKADYRVNRPAWPEELAGWWRTLIAHADDTIESVALNRHLIECLMGIVATTDDAGFGMSSVRGTKSRMDEQALARLFVDHTLCKEVHPSRAVVLPKLHNPLDGLTLRSLTHNLALWSRPEVSARWSNLSMRTLNDGLNLLVLPWPLSMDPRSFRSHDIPTERMPEEFGFFTYDASGQSVAAAQVKRLKDEAERRVGPIGAVVFPELSLSLVEFGRIQRALRNSVVIAGIGNPGPARDFGRNMVGVGSTASDDYAARFQHKHHRWRLNPYQVGTYGLGPSLGGRDSWWEAIRIPPRECAFYDVDTWLTFCVLICEDLARQDPVAELVRSVGPNLVVALLMDGPQVPERWSARYATVLAEDPRSSVLTLTCAGLVDMAMAQGNKGPRSIGLWKDANTGARKIILDPGSQGVVLSIARRSEREFVADGRDDGKKTGYLELTGVHQVRSN